MMDALKTNKFLSGKSVPFASIVYMRHFPSIIHTFTSIERDNIRHIYSNLMLLDELMSTLESDFKQDICSSAIENVNSAYIGKLKDILDSYAVIKKLIDKLLTNKPINIYHRDNEKT
jgi:hypothetical protein